MSANLRLTDNAWSYAKNQTGHSAYCLCAECYAAAVEYDKRSVCVCGLLPAEYSVPAETSNAICDTCGRTYTDGNDAPSNYLTDETLDEMGAAMDALLYAALLYASVNAPPSVGNRLADIRTYADAVRYVERNKSIGLMENAATFIGSYLSDGFGIDKETAARLALILAATTEVHSSIVTHAEKTLA